ncbi:hypothetical protein GEMRC1_003582 [Eukaryota sp. GEM-RC1]
MSFRLSPRTTLTILLNEPCFSDQTISFGQESIIKVNRFILAAHSTYFRSLWFSESIDKSGNFKDFSHLPVNHNVSFSFIKSFYGQKFTLNPSNSFQFYYLTHYFQVDKLFYLVETHLNTHHVTWAWVKSFIKDAVEKYDLRALEFVGPFLSKIDDILIDDVMAISTEGFKILFKYCTSTQSLSWLIKSMVDRIIHSPNFEMDCIDLDSFSNILNTCSFEVLTFKQWDEILFVPFKDELQSYITSFLLKVQDHCLDPNASSVIPTQLSQVKSDGEHFKQTITHSQLGSQSNLIRFSQTRKHSELQVSEDRTRVLYTWYKWRNILGENPLLPGNVYTWKLKYQGSSNCLWVGVIDESNFRDSGRVFTEAYCFANGGGVTGSLSGERAQWKSGEVLEINVNLIHYTITIRSVGNSSIDFTGTLPRVNSGNYYPFATLYCSDQVLEIVE